MHRPDPVPLADLLAGARRVVVLEDIVDHTNVGAIFRSAAGIGADAVLVTPRCADPLYRRAVRVSMGTVFQVPWGRVEPWPQALDDVRAAGFTVAALALTSWPPTCPTGSPWCSGRRVTG
jgi:tRNA G18 (ribose-2'-O)-methylase SpoU